MGNSKIVYYGETLIDLTGDTVEPAKLLKGVTAHDKAGDPITGTFEEVTPYAIISVTYPEGSVCTCSNGSMTLTAKDTSGKALFVIPSAGTWTVKAVSGSDTVSKAVSITAEGQVDTILLAFAIKIFSEQNGFEGSYTLISNGKSVIPAVDVTAFNKLSFYGRSVYAASAGNSTPWGLSKTVDGSLDAIVRLSESSATLKTIDVSSLSGLYYFVCAESPEVKRENGKYFISAGDSSARGRVWDITYS